MNVHPAKTEIRFLEPGKVYALCSAAFERLLEGERFTASGNDFQTPVSWLFESAPTPGSQSFFTPVSNPGETPRDFLDATPVGDYRGILFSTYFVFEKGDELTLIDQHAAHERIRYEQLRSRILKHDKIENQTLLVPEVVKLPLEKILEVRPKLPLLQSLGFDVEVFGEESLLFRSIPAVWGNRALTERLRNLVERLLHARVHPENPVWDETLFEKIAMEACRSSFKAGDAIPEFSALDLTRKLFTCEHPGNCPHGRPTSIRISKTKVEEWFSRLS